MATKKISQSEKILKFMKTHKRGITGQQAYKVAGSMCLPQRIYDLRKEGYGIESELIKVKNADGSFSWVSQYRLVK